MIEDRSKAATQPAPDAVEAEIDGCCPAMVMSCENCQHCDKTSTGPNRCTLKNAARAAHSALLARAETQRAIITHIYNGLPDTIENPDGYNVHLDRYWIDAICAARQAGA
jgi:hypothetical protein